MELNRIDQIYLDYTNAVKQLTALEMEYSDKPKGEVYQRRRQHWYFMIKQSREDLVKAITLRDIYEVTAGGRKVYISHLKESEIRYLLNSMGIQVMEIKKLETGEIKDLQLR